ncbi:MAG: glycosyltransferase family 4 protein [Bacteroidia bacterium]|nr:glycosyltransferase family 4 protein [Bacteroidia bacterium]MCZ2278289.1 glycosyltransferase family 4 protein [Bacteroidia bacterium]
MIKTLQLFEDYLPDELNWIFRLLDNLPDTELNIAAYRYHNEHFVTSEIHRLPLPHYVGLSLLEGKDDTMHFLGKIVNRFFNRLKNEKFFQFLTQYIRENNIELLHAHFANIGWHYLRLKELTGMPFLISFYGFDYESLPYRFPVWERRYQQLFEKADGFICEGHHGAETLKRQGCDQRKINIVPLGVRSSEIPAFNRIKNKGELKLLQLANYSEKKGHIYSLQAFIKALAYCPDMSLTFAGNDLEHIKSKLKSIVRHAGISDKVNFLNFVGFNELYPFFKDYHVFIHPSCYSKRLDCEGGAPVVLLDAQGTGMPVISTTHCDIPDEVIHGVTGLLSPEMDVNDLARSIRIFYEMDNEKYQQFAKAAREHILDVYDIQHCSAQLQKVYDEFRYSSVLRKNEPVN